MVLSHYHTGLSRYHSGISLSPIIFTIIIVRLIFFFVSLNYWFLEKKENNKTFRNRTDYRRANTILVQ